MMIAAGAGFACRNQERFMSEEQTVTYELEGEIALVGLNRPDKRNCFNPTVMRQLREAIDRAGEEAKCGIIFGHGDNFCAGLDLRWRRRVGRAGARSGCRFRSIATPFLKRWRAATFPSLPRCTVRRWAAGSKPPRPRTSASPTKPPSSLCPRERAASSSAAVARYASRGYSALPACRT